MFTWVWLWNMWLCLSLFHEPTCVCVCLCLFHEHTRVCVCVCVCVCGLSYVNAWDCKSNIGKSMDWFITGAQWPLYFLSHFLFWGLIYTGRSITGNIYMISLYKLPNCIYVFASHLWTAIDRLSVICKSDMSDK